MSDPTAFLHAFAQALSVLSLYPEGHPSRERAIDSAYQSLDALTQKLKAVAATKPASVVFRVRRGVRTLFVEIEPSWPK